ncbi:MAG TPA: NADPH-dependent F420 reductase [Steroidobacteraceae bacterium]|jgi:predicted dinucleotide-binding enzyme|nr:NADPH-dependent F420 reductase [Steroidobacteraceae bacterium]
MKRMLIPFLVALGSVACNAADKNPVPKSSHPMKIGIIGTGSIGGALARHWGAAGHELLISSRHPEELRALAEEIGPNVKVGTPREAAAFGEVVLVSVPYFATPQVGRDYAAELEGKVVLDTGNPYPGRDGDMAVRDRQRGTGVASTEYLPGTRLVRAFNAINAGPLANQAFEKPERLGIPLAADDPEAMRIAEQLVRDAGFDPVAVGGLARAREFDVGTPVYVRGMTAAELRKALKLK